MPRIVVVGLIVAAVAVGALTLLVRRPERTPVPAAVAPAAPAPTASAPPSPAAAPASADAEAPLPSSYDPVQKVQNGADSMAVFSAEPRDPVWAPAVEGEIGTQLRQDVKRVVPEASFDMSCRTLSCTMTVVGPPEKLPAALAAVALVTLGPITERFPIEGQRARMLFITDRRMADPNFFVSWYRRTRRRTLDEIAAGKRPNPLPVPPAALD